MTIPDRIWYMPGDCKRWYPARKDFVASNGEMFVRILGLPYVKDRHANSSYPLSWGRYKPRRKRFKAPGSPPNPRRLRMQSYIRLGA